METRVIMPVKSNRKSAPPRAVRLGLALALGLVGTLAPGASAEEARSSELGAVWTASGTELPLKTWSVQALAKLSPRTVTGKDASGKPVRWRGVLFSAWVDQALREIPLEKRAQVDLVLATAPTGEKAIIPRSAIRKYPVLLAFEKDGKPLMDGPVSVVVPESAHRAMAAEGLPLNTYSLPATSRIELSSYGARFSHLLLKRRTDPAAIRGEKMFVQNCIACHTSGRALSVTAVTEGSAARSLASSGHPKSEGVPQLSARDIRALVSYLDAYRGENRN